MEPDGRATIQIMQCLAGRLPLLLMVESVAGLMLCFSRTAPTRTQWCSQNMPYNHHRRVNNTRQQEQLIAGGSQSLYAELAAAHAVPESQIQAVSAATQDLHALNHGRVNPAAVSAATDNTPPHRPTPMETTPMETTTADGAANDVSNASPNAPSTDTPSIAVLQQALLDRAKADGESLERHGTKVAYTPMMIEFVEYLKDECDGALPNVANAKNFLLYTAYRPSRQGKGKA